MPIFKMFMAAAAAVGSLSAFGVSFRNAKEATRECGGFGAAVKKDGNTLWQNLTEVFRGGWK